MTMILQLTDERFHLYQLGYLCLLLIWMVPVDSKLIPKLHKKRKENVTWKITDVLGLAAYLTHAPKFQRLQYLDTLVGNCQDECQEIVSDSLLYSSVIFPQIPNKSTTMGCCISNKETLPYVPQPVPHIELQQQHPQVIADEPAIFQREPPLIKKGIVKDLHSSNKESEDGRSKSQKTTRVSKIITRKTEYSPYTTITHQRTATNPPTQVAKGMQIYQDRLFESVDSFRSQKKRWNITGSSPSFVNTRYSTVNNAKQSGVFRRSSTNRLPSIKKSNLHMIIITHSNPRVMSQSLVMKRRSRMIQTSRDPRGFLSNPQTPQQEQKARSLREIIRVYSRAK